MSGTLLAFDFGTKSIGVAVGQRITGTARPLPAIKAQDGTPDWNIIERLLKEWQPDEIIVGLPLNMDGTASELGNRAKKFARRLKHQLEEAHRPRPIILADERLTSREAKNLAWEYGLIKSDKEPIDSIASAIMLGSWLRSGEGALLS